MPIIPRTSRNMLISLTTQNSGHIKISLMLKTSGHTRFTTHLLDTPRLPSYHRLMDISTLNPKTSVIILIHDSPHNTNCNYHHMVDVWAHQNSRHTTDFWESSRLDSHHRVLILPLIILIPQTSGHITHQPRPKASIHFRGRLISQTYRHIKSCPTPQRSGHIKI